WLSQLCCLLVLLISMFNFDAYIFGVDALYRNFEINQMAVITAALFIMLAASIAFINPGEGIVSVFTRKTRASKVALRQLMLITVLILLAGVLIFNGEKAGYYTREFGSAFIMGVAIVITALMIWLGARELNTAEFRNQELLADLRRANQDLEAEVERRKETETALQRSNLQRLQLNLDLQEKLNEGLIFEALFQRANDGIIIWNNDREHVKVNPAAARMLGYSVEEMQALSAEDIVADPEVDEARWKLFFEKGELTGITNLKKKNGEVITCHFSAVSNLQPDEHLSILTDITERVHAQEALIESETRLRTIFETEPECIKLLSLSGELLEMNPAGLDMLEAGSLEEARSVPITALINPAHRSRFTDMLANVAKGETQVIEFEITGLKGTRRWLESNTTPMRDASGEITALLGVTRDVTRRREMEQQLRESNERYELASKATNDVIWEWRIEQNEVYYSHAYEYEFGYPGGQLHPLEVWLRKIYSPDYQRVVNSLRAKIEAADTSSWEAEYRYVKANGELAYVYDRGFLILDEEGRPVRFIGAMQDVTQRRLAEQELRNSNDRFRLVTLATNDVIWDWHLGSNIVTFSDAYEHQFGYPCRQWIAEWETHIHEEDRERVVLKLQASLRDTENEFWEDEYRFYAADGRILHIYDRGYIVFDENEKAVRLVGAMQDVTARKQAEQERDAASSEILRRNKDLEQFAFIVSHNLRAPVANILGITELLSGDISLPDTDRKTFLEALNASAGKLDMVIRDLSEILYIGKSIEDKKQPVSLSRVVNDISETIQVLLRRENVHIKTDFTAVDEISSFKSYVFSIFNNLITNSIKYRRPDQDPVIEISSERKNGTAIITFRDNGLGIDMERYQQQVFGLYRRFHPSTDGKGMGLFMTKKQIEALGGRIHVDSEVNKGTTFTVELPVG
ncbi:MAG TPA: PAS domain S-box protein, partial [Chitinophagaceae bacterium]